MVQQRTLPSTITFLPTFIIVISLLPLLLLQSQFLLTSASAASCSPRERDALLDFVRYAVQDDPAHYWFSSWSHPSNTTTNSDDCCTWQHVTCDDQGMVTRIQLNNWGNASKLRAELNPDALRALAAIDRLSILDFTNQLFHGSIAAEIGNLTSLTQLIIYNNSLSGNLPASMGSLKSLVYINLGSNQFALQEIPSSLLQIPSLKEIYLPHNNFTGAIPDVFTNLSEIAFLSLAYNQLGGLIPPSMQYLKSLVYLDLSYNQFSSQQIPAYFLQLPSLRTFYMDSTNLKGAIPDAFSNLTNIASLFLSRNQLDGPLPPSMQYVSSLQDVDLSCNNFRGDLPDMFANLTQITNLDLSHNQLSGLLPRSMKYLNSLQELHLSYNQFSSQEIPSTLLLLPSLNILDLSFNNFTGIDSFPSDSSSKINASASDFQSQLQYLNLASNKLTNNIFAEASTLRYLKNLVILDLRDNLLEGRFPESTSDVIQELLILNMNNNRLRGPIPSFVGSLKKIQLLDLGSNELNGSIPDWLGPSLSKELRVLLLARNRLTGTIPPNLDHLMAMQNSSFNRTEFQMADGSSIYNYYFPVDIPITIKGMTLTFSDVPFLSILDLSDNQLSGAIPPELGTLKGLVALNLSVNRLEGEIPSALGNLTYLESLDLSRNKLQGPIPATFEDLHDLGFVNLSSNRLSGSIPSSAQWDTFGESSFLDNDGLCTKEAESLAGLPLCGVGSSWSRAAGPAEQVAAIDDSGILGGIADWGGLAIGYPLGLVLGILVFCWNGSRSIGN